ncbi:MAG: PEGA domain-containing protein [Pseudomonadota bacterium]
MVDFRPLLFVNALALMLLVTAGFASVREDTTPLADAFRAEGESVAAQVAKISAEPEKAPEPKASVETIPETRRIETVDIAAEPSSPQPSHQAVPSTEPPRAAPTAEPFSIEPMPDNPTLVALAEPPSAMETRTDVQPEPVTPAPTTGKLVLRSNVVGDNVTINGRDYGATRLDLELEPGRYEVTISKDGFKSWSQTVAMAAGEDLTLVGKLEAYTRVNFQKGTWIGGVRTGDGTYEDASGLKYEGHFVDGEFHGEGTAWYPDGSRYSGDWSEGHHNGEGVWRSADNNRYTGQFHNDQFHGQGTLTLDNGDILTGQWSEGRLNGHGSLTTADGMLYVGGFRNDEFHGEGSLTYPDGRHYEGEFSNGDFHGAGAEVFADGKKYEGQYIEGKFHGKGRLRNPNGSSIEATFKHGEPYGQVRLTTAAGEVFTARTTEPGVCYRDKSYRATQCPQLEGW